MQQQRSFLDQVLCAMKSGFYMIAGDNHLSGGTEKKLQSTSQSQTSTPKRSWSLFGGLLPIWSTTAFWIPVKRLYVRSMLSKSMRCTQNCNICSWHRSTERAQIVSMAMPDHTSPYQHFKNWTSWTMKCCLIRRIHLSSCKPTATSSTISTTFSKENASTTNQRKKMSSKSSSDPKAQISMLQE